ncbi:MAG TPA: hypothetical protein PLW88_00735 [Syntrophorhabdaceae bacterium]|nr:hypothetical protein [Syntrophorhabdaceae bacterium]HPP05864.1 hypothetical protein [Syntrophorhabdaceae bacterium]
MKKTNLLDNLNFFLNNCSKTLKEFFFGMTVYELQKELLKEKGYLNNLLLLIVFGDLLGLPIFPPFYAMRIFPYIIPYMDKWKSSVLREKDLTDIVSGDL